MPHGSASKHGLPGYESLSAQEPDVKNQDARVNKPWHPGCDKYSLNVGIQDFGSALEEQGIQVIYVEWNPPAGGDQEMIDLLDKLL